VTAVPTFSTHTTLRVGGPADDWVTAQDEAQALECVRAADAAATPILVIGGGSNLLVSDDGFRGTALEVAWAGRTIDLAGDDVLLSLAAGEAWDDVVAQCVAEGWAGIEGLSGIPGRAGATPIQNVGAYGQDVSQVTHSVRVLDRRSGEVATIGADDCGFGYRTSAFKREPGRWLVLEVHLRLQCSSSGIVRYAELARALGVEVGDEAPIAAIRDAVLALRAAKGMVLDDADHDTWSAGSFFTNPVVAEDVAALLPVTCPRYPAASGVKVSAAWLIEHSGVSKGFRIDPGSGAAISSKHTLALVNAGGARARDLLALAAAVRERVHTAFGIDLHIEPTVIP
jgi:UDP-N-acetylmuramate dehydrogenase